jgi:hypothetical protein
MDKPAISELLNELHARLKGANAITEKDRELLNQLSVDIRALLAHSDEPTAANPHSVIDRLQDSIARFEVSHPELTDVMAQVSKTLADMGI